MRRCVLAVGLASLLSAISPAAALAQGPPPVQTFINTADTAGESLQVAGATTARGPFEPFLARYDLDDGDLLGGSFLPFGGAFVEHTYVDFENVTHAVVTRPGAPTIYAEILPNGELSDDDGTELPVANAHPFAIVPVGASSIVFANADDQVHAMWFGDDGAHRGTQSFEFPLTMSTFGNGALVDGGKLVVFGNAGATGGFALRLDANEQTATLTPDTTFDGDGFLDVTGLNDVAAGTPIQFAPAVNPARYVLFGPGSGGVRQQTVGPTGAIAGDGIAVPGVAIARAAGQLAAGEPVVLAGDVPPSGQSPFRFGLSIHPAGGAQSTLNTFAPFGNPVFAEDLALVDGKFVIAWTDSPSPGNSAGGFSVFDGQGQPVTSVGGTGHIRIDPVFEDLNDPPVFDMPEPEDVPEDGVWTITGLSLSDPDAGSQPVSVQLDANNGLLSLSRLDGLDFTTDGKGDGAADRSMRFRGTLAAINAALDGLRFTPDEDYAGDAVIQVFADDLGNTGAGGAGTDENFIAFTILPVNDPATVTPGPGGATFKEGDEPLRLLPQASIQDVDSASLFDGWGYAALAQPLPGDELGFAPQNGITGEFDAESGVLRLEGQVSVAQAQEALRSVTFQNTLDDPVPGPRTFTIRIDDGHGLGPQATILALVEAMNDPPVNHLPGEQQGKVGETVSLGSAFISDADASANDELTVRIITSHGDARVDGRSGTNIVLTGTLAAINAKLKGLTFTPTTDLAGVASITFRTSDQGHNGTGGPAEDVDTVRFVLPGRPDPTATATPTPEPTVEPLPVLPSIGHSSSIRRFIDGFPRGTLKRPFMVEDVIVTAIGPGSGTFDLFTVFTSPRTDQIRLTVNVTEPAPALRAGANAAAGRKPVRYKVKRVTLAPRGDAIVRLKPPAKLRRQLARALKRGGRVARRPAVKVTVAGKSRTVKMRFTVRSASKRR